MKKKRPKMVLGRPSKYDPKYCEMLYLHMKRGLSFESFAAVADVCLDTLHEWAKVHEDFSYAKKKAFAANLQFWEEQGVKALWAEQEGVKFNSTVWIFNMKNRHKWRDRHDVEISSSDKTSSQVLITLPDNGRSVKKEKE